MMDSKASAPEGGGVMAAREHACSQALTQDIAT
jgi:hypothetical protein